MGRTNSEESFRDRMIRDFERALETMKQDMRARASGEIPDTYPRSVEVPASIVPPPFEEAVAELKNSLHAALSLIDLLGRLLDEACSASFKAQIARALMPGTAVIEEDIDALTRACVKASEDELRAARTRLREILSTAKLRHRLAHLWDEKTRQVLRELFACAHERLASDPGESADD